MEKNQNMTSGKPIKLLFFFALPLMLGNIFQQLYTVVDTAIVGKGVGMSALAALGSVAWLNWLPVGIAQGFTQGFSVKMSQNFGKGDKNALRKTIGASATLSIIISVIATIISLATLPACLDLLDVQPELRSMAYLYSEILILGIPITMFYNFCSSVLRAVGDSKTPLVAMIAAALINVVLDLWAVYGLHLGIAGAAIATLIAQCAAGFLCTLKISRMSELRFRLNDMKCSRSDSKMLLKLGIPVAFQNIIITAGGMAVQTVVNGFDTPFIAGFTAAAKLYGVLEIAAISYGYAVTTYIGQNYGARKWDRIKQGVRAAVALSAVTSAVTALIMVLFGRPLSMLFISAETAEAAMQAGDAAYLYLFVMSVFIIIIYLLYVYRAALQGMGNTFISMISGIIEFIMRSGVAVIVGITGFKNGIVAAEPVSWFGGALLLIIVYYYSAYRIEKYGFPENIKSKISDNKKIQDSI